MGVFAFSFTLFGFTFKVTIEVFREKKKAVAV
jgi:hypothetical protein